MLKVNVVALEGRGEAGSSFFTVMGEGTMSSSSSSEGSGVGICERMDREIKVC